MKNKMQHHHLSNITIVLGTLVFTVLGACIATIVCISIGMPRNYRYVTYSLETPLGTPDENVEAFVTISSKEHERYLMILKVASHISALSFDAPVGGSRVIDVPAGGDNDLHISLEFDGSMKPVSMTLERVDGRSSYACGNTSFGVFAPGGSRGLSTMINALPLNTLVGNADVVSIISAVCGI
jgi:hypothetical protein